MKDGNVTNPVDVKPLDNSYMGWAGSSAFTNIAMTDSTKTLDYYRTIKSNTKYAPHEGFYPDYTNIQDQAQKRINEYRDKIEAPLYRNSLTEEGISMAIDDVRQSGTDTVIAVVQRQLDIWMASKKK